jgi:small GTP-binding protein
VLLSERHNLKHYIFCSFFEFLRKKMSVLQKIAEIEREMDRTQKNKATNYHLGLLKAKLAKLKSQLVSDSCKKGGAGEATFEVSKTGDARVGLIGFPSVGKSTLLTKLTGTFSEAAGYEFTTLTCVPGMFTYKGAKIQVLDLPGIIEGAKDGKGRGRQVISVAMTCSLILIVLDASKPLTHKRIIEKELESFGIRLNKKSPNIIIQKKDRGGINITVAPGYRLKGLDNETITQICKEYRILNATISIRCNATADDLIDTIDGNRHYVPAVYTVNMVDRVTVEELELLSRVPHYVMISAQHSWNIDGLVDKMWEYMALVRVFTKPKGRMADFSAPVILNQDHCKIADFCRCIHKGLLESFKIALVWGKSVKHQPQRVGREHTLDDEDIVQIVKKVG